MKPNAYNVTLNTTFLFMGMLNSSDDLTGDLGTAQDALCLDLIPFAIEAELLYQAFVKEENNGEFPTADFAYEFMEDESTSFILRYIGQFKRLPNLAQYSAWANHKLHIMYGEMS